MKHIKISIAMFCFIVLTIQSVSATSYWYDLNGKELAVPEIYTFTKSISLNHIKDKNAVAPKDIFVDKQNNVYVLDSGNGRIIVLDGNNFSPKTVIDKFVTESGEQFQLIGADGTTPQGIFVDDSGKIFIADTGNMRIVVCDINGRVSRLIYAPSNLESTDKDFVFKPTKLAVDSIGRIYVVAVNVNMGLIQMDNNGNFISFVGAPPVVPNLFSLFWRRFSTKKQIDSMLQFVPTEYSNIAVDDADFIYGCISALDKRDLAATITAKDLSGKTTPIRKLNPSGQDILRRQGAYPPVGDLNKENPSKITDVALGSNGIYSLLDFEKGHIFSYDEDGNLLGVFGSKGTNKDEFVTPEAISFLDDKMIVLDSSLNQINVFDVTNYGRQLLNAVSLTYIGEYDQSYKSWEEITAKNPAFSQAYIGVGKSRMLAMDYKTAMKYFNMANDKTNYSAAFELYRKELVKNSFGYVFILIIAVVLIMVLYKTIKKLIKYARGE